VSACFLQDRTFWVGLEEKLIVFDYIRPEEEKAKPLPALGDTYLRPSGSYEQLDMVASVDLSAPPHKVENVETTQKKKKKKVTTTIVFEYDKTTVSDLFTAFGRHMISLTRSGTLQAWDWNSRALKTTQNFGDRPRCHSEKDSCLYIGFSDWFAVLDSKLTIVRTCRFNNLGDIRAILSYRHGLLLVSQKKGLVPFMTS